MSLYTQTSCQYPKKRHVIIQTGVSEKRRNYPNKRHVIIQTSDVIIETSFTTLSKQAPRHYPNKHPNPSVDTPHRAGPLGMNMYIHINYSQSVLEWIVVVQV